MEHLGGLLQLLSDGRYISGEEIGMQLNVTRAAVWKQIKKLEAEGLPIESSRGKGYRIAGGLSLLNAGAIERLIAPEAALHLRALHVYGVVASTNELALQCLELERASGNVFLAEGQSQGRGRRGRGWVSPYAANIYLSLIGRFENGVAAVEGLSLAVGVAVAQALAATAVNGVRLKWPNDVLWGNRKLGGILLELVGDPTGACDVVVGIGVNVNMPDHIATAIDQPWIDLKQIRGELVDRNVVAAALINQVMPLLANYQKCGFTAYRSKWERLDALRDQSVVLELGARQVEGWARGVDEAGSIRIESLGEVRSYPAGDISLRPAR